MSHPHSTCSAAAGLADSFWQKTPNGVSSVLPKIHCPSCRDIICKGNGWTTRCRHGRHCIGISRTQEMQLYLVAHSDSCGKNLMVCCSISALCLRWVVDSMRINRPSSLRYRNAFAWANIQITGEAKGVTDGSNVMSCSKRCGMKWNIGLFLRLSTQYLKNFPLSIFAPWNEIYYTSYSFVSCIDFLTDEDDRPF